MFHVKHLRWPPRSPFADWRRLDAAPFQRLRFTWNNRHHRRIFAGGHQNRL